jgi:hypothetical protein
MVVFQVEALREIVLSNITIVEKYHPADEPDTIQTPMINDYVLMSLLFTLDASQPKLNSTERRAQVLELAERLVDLGTSPRV